MSQIADKVYRNAKIYSIALDGTETRAAALAIKDGKFAYVGDEAGVQDWIGDTTEIIDCGGKSIIPELGDRTCTFQMPRKSSARAVSATLYRIPKRIRLKTFLSRCWKN